MNYFNSVKVSDFSPFRKERDVPSVLSSVKRFIHVQLGATCFLGEDLSL